MSKKYTFLSALMLLSCFASTLPVHLQASTPKSSAISSKPKAETPWWTIHVLLLKQAETPDLVEHNQPILRDEATHPSIPANHVAVPIEPKWEARCEQLKKAGYTACWVVAWQQPMAPPFVAQPLLEPCHDEDTADEESNAPLFNAGEDSLASTPNAPKDDKEALTREENNPSAQQAETMESPTTPEAASTHPSALILEAPNNMEATPHPQCQPQTHPIFQGQLTLSMTPRKTPRIALTLYANPKPGSQPTIAWRAAHTLKMGRLYYLDHAQVGAIIQVTPSPEPPYIDDDSLDE